MRRTWRNGRDCLPLDSDPVLIAPTVRHAMRISCGTAGLAHRMGPCDTKSCFVSVELDPLADVCSSSRHFLWPRTLGDGHNALVNRGIDQTVHACSEGLDIRGVPAQSVV